MGGRARGRICAQQRVRQDREVLDRDGLEAEVECAGLMGGIDARFDQPHELVEDRIMQGDWKRQDAIETALDRRKIIDHRTAEHTSELQSITDHTDDICRLDETKTTLIRQK